jgi:ATP-binding cassette subfamily B protein
VRLLLRFREPQQGSVELDGANVRSLDLSGLRQSIGLVSQHTYLFSGSVADNIRYGSFSADDEAVQVAAVAAEADAFIQELPEGMDTPIGERGQKLSGGQRQRLAIARAFVKDPPILVLDEATSAVDNRTEEAIQRSLARVSTGRTTLIIAHRLSTIRHADRIVVLDQGAVVESGTHEELVRGAGLYQHLWAVQTGDAA